MEVMEDEEVMLRRLFEGQPLLLNSEVPEELKQHLAQLVERGVVGCRTLKPGPTKVFWAPRSEAQESPVARTPLQAKRPHPKFVSPLLSSRREVKEPRLTPTSNAATTTTTSREENPQPPTPRHSEGNMQTEGDESNTLLEQVRKLEEEKKLLERSLTEREDKLRKLKMVKLYRSKNDLEQLEELIVKWRQTSQEAAETLLASSTREPRPTMTQLLDYLHIDKTLIRYSTENDSFY